MTLFLTRLLKPAITALLIAAIGAGFTYWIHDPKIGIDDANITQTYAKNIANGFGYVYNEGGERVEGSTSLLWTIFNVLSFNLSNSPELIVTVFCFFLTALIVNELLLFLKHCSQIFRFSYNTSTFILGFLLIANPSFFSWSTWALMDTTLWILCFTTILCRLLLVVICAESHGSYSPISIFIPCSLLIILPLVRPEGFAISLGLTGLLFIYAHTSGLEDLRRQLLITIGLTIVVFFALTVFRMLYFGFPFPNTFFAKVSINYLEQIVMGVKYLIRYLIDPTAAVVLVLAFVALINIYLRNTLSLKNLRWFLVLFVSAVFGIFLVYVMLGGDHFGSARQFQVLTPLLVAFATLSILSTGDRCLERMHAMDATLGKVITILIMIFVACTLTLPSVAYYYHSGGGMSQEFRIAESQRKLGETLNKLPELPSIGVVAAGGISRTYKGHIYDMMGLNWIEMAHANRKHNKPVAKNHAAFNKEVFFKYMPKIVSPSLGECKKFGDASLGFLDLVLDGLLSDERFLKNYKIACFQGTVFYVKLDWFDKWNKYLSEPI
jgi:arabinofuranosyltransferase